jgi:hypothetical protein
LTLPPNNGIAALSPDGRAVVLMRDQPSLMLEFVEVATGLKRMEIRPMETYQIVNWPPITSYSSDGSLFLVSDGEGQMQVFDAFSGSRLGAVSGRSGSFSSYSFSGSGRMLATLSSSDTTGLVWDARAIFGSMRKGPLEVSPEQISALWDDLASKDATRAYQAIGRLVWAPRQTLPWLREHLKPVSTVEVDKKRLDQLLAKLDNDDFAVREQAAREIEKLGQQALPTLEQALEAKPSAEAGKRIRELVERIAPERWRPLRAVEVLEHIGNTEAQDILRMLASGTPEARLTQEAKAALARLQVREAAQKRAE